MKILYDNIHNYEDEDYNNFLLNSKKEKINNFININDKKRSLLGEHLLDILLLKKQINYENVILYKNKFGKPFIKNFNLFYNISHSYDYSICIISNTPVGIDIEKIRKVNNNVIKQFATSNEMKYIDSDNNKNIYTKIFEIYTLKEAYFKCLGTNLNNIKNVEFSINKNNIKCSNSKIKANLHYNINGYVIATCEIKK